MIDCTTEEEEIFDILAYVSNLVITGVNDLIQLKLLTSSKVWQRIHRRQKYYSKSLPSHYRFPNLSRNHWTWPQETEAIKILWQPVNCKSRERIGQEDSVCRSKKVTGSNPRCIGHCVDRWLFVVVWADTKTDPLSSKVMAAGFIVPSSRTLRLSGVPSTTLIREACGNSALQIPRLC